MKYTKIHLHMQRWSGEGPETCHGLYPTYWKKLEDCFYFILFKTFPIWNSSMGTLRMPLTQ